MITNTVKSEELVRVSLHWWSLSVLVTGVSSVRGVSGDRGPPTQSSTPGAVFNPHYKCPTNKENWCSS